jgi:hypothetical protein
MIGGRAKSGSKGSHLSQDKTGTARSYYRRFIEFSQSSIITHHGYSITVESVQATYDITINI